MLRRKDYRTFVLKIVFSSGSACSLSRSNAAATKLQTQNFDVACNCRLYHMTPMIPSYFLPAMLSITRTPTIDITSSTDRTVSGWSAAIIVRSAIDINLCRDGNELLSTRSVESNDEDGLSASELYQILLELKLDLFEKSRRLASECGCCVQNGATIDRNESSPCRRASNGEFIRGGMSLLRLPDAKLRIISLLHSTEGVRLPGSGVVQELEQTMHEGDVLMMPSDCEGELPGNEETLFFATSVDLR